MIAKTTTPTSVDSTPQGCFDAPLFVGKRHARYAGFSLIEALGAVLILGLTLSAAVASFSYMMRNERRATTQVEMDMDSHLLVEHLRRDLWNTSREMIMVHPEGEGPHLAISFPIIRSVSPQVDEENRIVWDATVIYHMTDGVPSQVRRTVFSPRDNDLEPEERRRQLVAVVNDGNGDRTYNSGNARTRDLITNLVDWELNVTGSRFDTYTPSSGRRRFSLGTALLHAGDNTITFEVDGKNSQNTGSARHLGIDSLTVTPSGLPREAEWMSVQSSSGSSPVVQNMGTGETWSGNSRLWFPSTTDGDSFTLSFKNDRWEERNFYATGASREDLERAFIEPDNAPPTFDLRLDGDEAFWPDSIVWSATEQTRASISTAYLSDGIETRIFVRGSDLLDQNNPNFYDGGWIHFNGTNVWARFRGVMRVEQAFIAKSAEPTNPDEAWQYIPETRRDFSFDGQPGKNVDFPVESDPADFLIETDESYIVGFHLSTHTTLDVCWPRTWTTEESERGDMPHAYVYVPDVDEEGQDVGEGEWVPSYTVHGLRELRAGHSPEGIYTSQIIDTGVDNPDYQSFDWTAQVPDGSLLELKVRAGSDRSDLTGTSDWEGVPVAQAGQAPFAQGRYAQVRARMKPGIDSDGETYTPRLRDFTLSWDGGRRYAEISGVFSTGPNHGIYEVRVNGAPLVKGVTVDVTVFKDIGFGGGPDGRITSSAFSEIVPRNRGGTLHE